MHILLSLAMPEIKNASAVLALTLGKREIPPLPIPCSVEQGLDASDEAGC